MLRSSRKRLSHHGVRQPLFYISFDDFGRRVAIRCMTETKTAYSPKTKCPGDLSVISVPNSMLGS